MAAALSRRDTVIHIPIDKSVVGQNATRRETPNGNYDTTGVSGNRDCEDPPSAAATSPPTLPIPPSAPSPSRLVQASEIRRQMDGSPGAQPVVIDPISRQILERTASQPRASGAHNGPPSAHGNAVIPDDLKAIARQSTGLPETDSLRRSDSLLSNKGPKEKKKGFLSRFLGNKNKDDAPDPPDNVSEMMDHREAGSYAEVFSQPIGFVPKFPAPPRYIRVKAQNRKKRDFDRLFLAQILSEGAPRIRKASDDFDSKIHAINDRPTVTPPNSTRTKNNAIWAAEFSRDGQYYAAGGQDKKLKVWRVISSKEDRELAEDESGKNVKLNAPVFKQELVREYEGHTSAILDLSWSKNNFLLSSSMDKTVRLYHISRPECLCAFKHNDFVTSIAFHPRDDRFFLAGSLDAKLRLWSIPDKNVAYWAQAQDMITAVAFTPDGKTAITGTLSGLCTLYDTDGLKAHSQIHARSNRGKNSKGSKITGIETIAIPRQVGGAPDVKLLITSNDSRVRLYNLRDRSLEAKFRGNENSSSQIRASFSDDGKYIVCGSEDKRVYIWPTGPLERQDSDKQPVETFEAHAAIVTTALLLPTKSRVLLARSGDPIYDLCNPPPVRLLSRTDSVLSSRAPTDNGESKDDAIRHISESPPPPVEETPQYAARHVHNGGLILVTGDYTGEIKVFRQDCAYQKRREGSWDTSSFSKRMLGRSGSVTTRTSERSSTYRKSMTLGEPRSPGNRDNIINWRNSVMSAKSASATTSTSEIAAHETHQSPFQQERDRSVSPAAHGKLGLAHRFSLHRGSTPLANSVRPSTEGPQHLNTAPTSQGFQRLSDATINGHGSPYYSATESVRRPSSPTASENVRHAQKARDTSTQDTIPDISLTTASPVVEGRTGDDPYDNGLFLFGDQSYMAYDVKHSLVPMAQAQPRTPGPNVRPGELGRETSFISTLSSEGASTNSPSPLDERRGSAGLGINGANWNEGEKSETEELKCRRCGNEKFAMVRHLGGNQGPSGLKCRNCGYVMANQ